MSSKEKINISEEDLAQAYQSGFADGSIVRDKTVVSAEYHSQLQRSFTQLTLSNAQLRKDYERLIAEHNCLADSISFFQQLIDARHAGQQIDEFYGQFFDAVRGHLEDLREVSPF